MKRVILILLVAFGFIVGIFADGDNAKVELTLTIGEQSVPKWFSQVASAETWASFVDKDKDLTDDDVDVGADLTIDLYPSVKTNSTSKIQMKVTGKPMTSDGVGSTIGVTATGDGADTSFSTTKWTSSSPDGYVMWTEEANGTADRVISKKLTLTLDSNDFAAALGSTNPYKAELTLEIQSV